jgi:hypothetical protein
MTTITLYHRTTADAADAILHGGFKDATGYYLTENLYTGVWLSDVPLDVNEGAKGDTLLRVELRMSQTDLDDNYEWVTDGAPYREWLVPADVINTRKVSVVVVAED